MTYTFKPEQKFAKASGKNMRISYRKAAFICKTIRGKPLRRAKRLLSDLKDEKRTLDGKYYTKTVEGILNLLESCEKNAEFLGLDADRLFVHASSHQGTTLRRRRRKAGFGSRMKAANMEIMLIEKGKASEKVSKDKMQKKKTEAEKKIDEEKAQARKEIESLKEKGKEIKAKSEAAAEHAGHKHEEKTETQ